VGNSSGRIRLIIPGTATKAVILPKLAKFDRSYPETVLEITSSNDPVDLVAGEYHAGVQLGEFIQRDMIAVRVTKELRLTVVGSPEYFELNSIPKHPQDLKNHSCIGFASAPAVTASLSFFAFAILSRCFIGESVIRSRMLCAEEPGTRTISSTLATRRFSSVRPSTVLSAMAAAA
jgi:DNA-binding transcriptional LysR family regulator